MAKQTKAETKPAFEAVESVVGNPEMDSKYRLIIVAAQRSKQIQRGARPRVDMDIQRHKATRVALEEVQQGKIAFHFTEKE
ncbi:MAG: DNA-directed RNA polymerase subunit omega [Acidobacteria bacterium]|nr:DNA-directed RNA polymerase subunit omega [Acidobacteriota bacterium]